MLRKILLSLVCLSFVAILFVSTSGKSQLEGNNFDSTLSKWLAHLGFNGEVLEYQKIYDENGFVDYFRILLQEGVKPDVNERTQAKIFMEITDNESYEFANVKIMDKDIRSIKYMYNDWVARFAINYAIKNVSKLLGLQPKTEKVKEGLYKMTLQPAKTTAPSRYRFTEIIAFYEIKDLFLSLDVTIKGPKDYLILTFVKSEVNAVLRALENGNFPGATSSILTSQIGKGSSDYLLRDLLKVPEAARDTILLFERNPELKERVMNQEGEF